jgi:hypothetical protein
VKVIARAGQSPAAAERDPSNYHYFAPCCGAELSDVAAARGSAQKASRSRRSRPRSRRRSPWIGCPHLPPLHEAAPRARARVDPGPRQPEREARRREQGPRRVLRGSRDAETTVEVWEKLIVPEGEAGAYERGKVPSRGAWLTAGTDANSSSSTGPSGGGGNVETEAGTRSSAAGSSTTASRPARQASDKTGPHSHAEDLEVFDQVLYELWPTAANGTANSSSRSASTTRGWQHVAVYDYCRSQPGRAIPVQGLRRRRPGAAPPVTWSARPEVEGR